MTQEQTPQPKMEMYSGSTYSVNERGLAIDSKGADAQVAKRQAAVDLAQSYLDSEDSKGDEERAQRDLQRTKEALQEAQDNLEKMAYFKGTEDIIAGLETSEKDLIDTIAHEEAKIQELKRLKDEARVDSVAEIFTSAINTTALRLDAVKKILLDLQTEMTVAKLYLEVQMSGSFNQQLLEAFNKLRDNGVDFSALQVGKDLLADLDNYYLSYAGAARELVHMYDTRDENNDEKKSKKDSYLDEQISQMETKLRAAGINVDSRDEVKRISELKPVEGQPVKKDDKADEAVAPENESVDNVINVIDEAFADTFNTEITNLKDKLETLLTNLKVGVTEELSDEFDKLDKEYDKLDIRLDEEADEDVSDELRAKLSELDIILKEAFDILKPDLSDDVEDDADKEVESIKSAKDIIAKAILAFQEDADAYLANDELRKQYFDAAKVVKDAHEQGNDLVDDTLLKDMDIFKEAVNEYVESSNDETDEGDAVNDYEKSSNDGEEEKKTPLLKRIRDGINNMFAPGSRLRKGLKSIGNAFSEDRMRNNTNINANREEDEAENRPELPELSQDINEGVLGLRVEVDEKSAKDKVLEALNKITELVKAKKDELGSEKISQLEVYIQDILKGYGSTDTEFQNFKFNLEDSEAADTSGDSGDLPSDEELSKFGI